MPTVSDTLLDTAIRAADTARTITRRYFRAPLTVTHKTDKSPVTIADQETEHAIKQLILQRHPQHGFSGEESGPQNGHSAWQWLIDPIDGTKAFLSGIPTFGTLIALLYEGTPLLGIIDHAILAERWIGIHGRTTTHNGNPCTTSTHTQLKQARLCATTIDMFTPTTLPHFNTLAANCKLRVFGGDCYNYGLLAAGYTDIICEADLKPYDYLALAPVVLGAGGCITDWKGQTLTQESGDQVLASANPKLHHHALECLESR